VACLTCIQRSVRSHSNKFKLTFTNQLTSILNLENLCCNSVPSVLSPRLVLKVLLGKSEGRWALGRPKRRFVGSVNILSVSWDTSFNYCVQKITQIFPVLSQTNPVQTLAPFFSKIHFDTVFSSMPKTSKLSFPFKVSDHKVVRISTQHILITFIDCFSTFLVPRTSPLNLSGTAYPFQTLCHAF
jgi:hypothetical protein